jgi:20S proteasome alpha/beta subunit
MLHRSVVITFLFMFLQDAASSNRLAPGEISMGTTILAVRYNGGIVVGADT